MTVMAYKLFRVMKNGEIKSLFIDASKPLPVGQWLQAECIPTKGFAVRFGWHAAPEPKADHLTTKGRAWYLVELKGVTSIQRPKHQGGSWYLGDRMRIVGRV